MKLLLNPIALCLCMLLVTGESVAQVPDGLFAGEAPLSFTLTARMQAIMKDRTQPAHDSLAIKHPAQLTYLSDSASRAVGTIPLALVVRGNFRRKATNCTFPPLYVDFPKKRVAGTPFAGQNTLKLVTHCQSDDYVVREYLVYKLYNLITDLSFRARLARVTYVESAKKRPVETHWAFLVEDEDDVARRNNRRERKMQTPFNKVDSLSLATMAVFEFMIGNIDWDVESRHNVRLMTQPGTDKLPSVVPYDFDHSVIVDAAYASRADDTGQRIYRGPLYPGWLLKRVFSQFTELRPRFYALYTSDARLNEAYVKQTIMYLDKFYDLINSPDAVKSRFFSGDKDGALFASFSH
ncbi:hypothetical protein J2I47_04345 [Fibrella sp. HMF5335]|uniref:Uncharacterized protein n=1 Tax=Fibrella rubiginis TaxID=2817060 RepID=A0A939K440_9BACT|nr:hypothetical protein [Fibrella rubiginis]MBO0935771.1 hypothetical protein [Fibrella rubiginis]